MASGVQARQRGFGTRWPLFPTPVRTFLRCTLPDEQRHPRSRRGMWVEGTKVRLGVSPHGRTQSRRSPPQPQPGCRADVGEAWGHHAEGKLENDQKARYLLVEVIGPSFCPPLLLSTGCAERGVTAIAHYIFCLICKPQLVPVHWRLQLEKGQTPRNRKGKMPARS